MSLLPHLGPPRAAPAPVPPAPHDPKLDHPLPCQHIADTVGATTHNEGTNVESRQSTLYKNEAASARCCDDGGRRMIDAMEGTELSAAAPKPRSRSAEAQSRADEAEASFYR